MTDTTEPKKTQQYTPRKDMYKNRVPLDGGGGGKSTPSVKSPAYNPPPAAPAVEEAATTVLADTPADEEARRKSALKLGAKSLKIPLTTGGKATGLAGTGS